MVILIGGNSYTGKTLLSQKLLERYKIPYLSIDHLKMGLYRGLEDEKYSPVQDSYVLGEILWPIVKGIIMTNIENKQNVIIEGCYILPHLLNDFDDDYLDKIISVFLGFSENYIRNNLQSKIISKRNVIEYRGEGEFDDVDQLILEHKIFSQKCFDNNVNYFEIDNDYDTIINDIIAYIDNKIG